MANFAPPIVAESPQRSTDNVRWCEDLQRIAGGWLCGRRRPNNNFYLSYISGPVKKTGNDSFVFPTGKNGEYHAIEITAPSSTTDAFTAEYFDTSSAVIGTGKDTSMTHLNTCGYWNLARTTGSSQVKVQLDWNSHDCMVHVLSIMRIARWSSSNSKWENIGSVGTSGNATTGSIQSSSNQNSFGYFTLGKRSPAVYAHAGTDSTVCYNSTFTLGVTSTGTGGVPTLSYSWTPTTGLSSSTAANPTYMATDTTMFIVTVTDADYKTAKDTQWVFVPAPVVADAGSDATLCKHELTTLGGSPTATGGTSPYTYLWSSAETLSSHSSSNPVLDPESSSNARLLVTDNMGCTARDTIQFIVNEVPIADAGENYTICKGTGAALGGDSTGTGGTPPYTYVWKDGSNVTVSNDPNPAILLTDEKYIVTVTDSNGCIAKDSVEIAFTDGPLAHAGTDTTVCYGSWVQLGADSVADGGTWPYSVSWYPVTEFDHYKPVVQCISSTDFILHVEDASGCPGTDDTMHVEVTPGPMAMMDSVARVCSANDTVLIGNDDLFEGGLPPFTYHWHETNFISDTTITNPIVASDSNSVYQLEVMDSLGCTYNYHVRYLIYHPYVNAGPDAEIMSGAEIRLGWFPTVYSGVGDVGYHWFPGVADSTAANPVVMPDSTAEYIIEANDETGCSSSDTIEITVTPHADSIQYAIDLGKLIDTITLYTLRSADSVTWFKFTTDSTHFAMANGVQYDYPSNSYTKMKLFELDNEDVKQLEEISLGNISLINMAGLAYEELDSEHIYYLKYEKDDDNTSALDLYLTSETQYK